MKSLDLTKPVTTESLLIEFESRFNMTMDLTQLDEVELQDYANHVRTKIHAITQNTHFGQELKDDAYQKNQMMLDIINQAIQERKLAEYGGNMNDPEAKAGSTAISAKDKLDKGQTLSQDEKKVVSKMLTKEGVEEQSELILAAKDSNGIWEGRDDAATSCCECLVGEAGVNVGNFEGQFFPGALILIAFHLQSFD